MTLVAVLATIVITAQDRRGAAQRLRDEREHSDRQLTDQQAFSDAQIALQLSSVALLNVGRDSPNRTGQPDRHNAL